MLARAVGSGVGEENIASPFSVMRYFGFGFQFGKLYLVVKCCRRVYNTYVPFLIHMSNKRIYIVRCVWLADRPAGGPFFVAITLTLDSTRNLFNQIHLYVSCIYRHH